MLNFFAKKQKPEPFKEDQKADLPPSIEPQTKKSILRGAHGRFVSKSKAESGAKEEAVPKDATKSSRTKTNEPVTVTFYGKDVRKTYSNGKWYFAIDDVIGLATSPDPDSPVKMKADFDKTKKEISTTIDNVIFADLKGCLLIITKVNGIFPGPITRWLNESAALAYSPEPLVKENAGDEKTITPVNPADIR